MGISGIAGGACTGGLGTGAALAIGGAGWIGTAGGAWTGGLGISGIAGGA